MIRWEIEEAINGYRLNIWPHMGHVYKENTETYTEALKIVRLSIETEIRIEQDRLRQASGQIH